MITYVKDLDNQSNGSHIKLWKLDNPYFYNEKNSCNYIITIVFFLKPRHSIILPSDESGNQLDNNQLPGSYLGKTTHNHTIHQFKSIIQKSQL
jgi:hypothetical protein